MDRRILGISCYYHDSAVAAVENGSIKFAIQEERLSRVKHDSRFPIMAIAKLLEHCKWRIRDIDTVVFYERPDLKLERLYSQAISSWPRSWKLFSQRIPTFYRYKFPIEKTIRDKLGFDGTVRFSEHHRSHAASAFYTSPFEDALVITLDGVGEFETTAVFKGEGNTLTKLGAIHFPDSLGLFYSVFTQYLGFEVNEGEYKVMGLASYGAPRYVDRMLNRLIHLHEDGSFTLNPRDFDFSNVNRQYTSNLVNEIKVKPRMPKDEVLQVHEDLAASVQAVLEMAICNLVKSILDKYQFDNLCMAGGVALNCTANSRIVRQWGIPLHVHPAAGDAGGALGAALAVAIEDMDTIGYRFPFTPYLGVNHEEAIAVSLEINHVPFRRSPHVAFEIARQLSEGKVVAIFHGRDEWGPRALGDRSILADPRDPKMKDHLNSKIKFREEFRPFAPVVKEEAFRDYFDTLGMTDSPFMLFTYRALHPDKIPAAVHVDGTSRAQTVSDSQNSYLYSIILEFEKLTGVPVLINTSLNLKGEPIVCTPTDALKTFLASGIDILAIEDYLVEKIPAS